MHPKQIKKVSKFLSYVLRHNPDKLHLTIEPGGWADVDEILKAMDNFTLEDLKKVVELNDKKRFAFSEDGTKIRASQGHSIDVDLKLNQVEPPEHLFHGTCWKSYEAIRKEGIRKQGRTHVHLSDDPVTAMSVGRRKGNPLVLLVKASNMHNTGATFYKADNDVWLVDYVPPGEIVPLSMGNSNEVAGL
ncbi:MAG: RNA 2'-phosphotransferase [Candidatus Riesia sp.]|nr:RNA 2'-phosphotransferase [Candidatus Riesia sp.]